MSKISRIIIFLLLPVTLARAQDEGLKKLYTQAREAYSASNLDSAMYYAEQLAQEAEKANSDKYRGRAGYIKGNVYTDQEKNKEAYENYFEALKLSQKAKDMDIEGNLLNRIGALYFEEKNYNEAKIYFAKEIELKERKGDTTRLTHALLNISMLYRRLNDYKTSEDLLGRVRKIIAVKNDSTLRAYFYDNLATCFFGKFTVENKVGSNDEPDWSKRHFTSAYLRDSAEIYWKKSLAIWEALGRKENAKNPLFNLGYVYQTKNDLKSALKNYLAAREIVESMGSTPGRITCYGNIAEVYYDLKDYKNASDYFRRLIQLKDSVQKNEEKEYSLQLSKQYQLETNSTILKQELELANKNAEIDKQQKRVYIYILIFVALVFTIIVILAYISFNRRVNKKIEEAKEKFFTNIMHEIRTPLSMIQAPLKTLKPKLNDEESAYYIALAEKNVVRLNELINQMLDISKVENSGYKLVNAVGNLDLFLKDLIAAYEKLAVEKSIHFVTQVNYNHTLLVYDRDALEKIVTNLLSNAVKYTPQHGTIGLTVNVEDNENQSVVLIEVWDTGIGIPKSEHHKIFDRFFRSEKSVNKAAGVGIGLSLVKDLVLAYKGKINFTSEENKGAKFTVELVLKHPEQTIVTTENYNESGRPVILLVEDDTDILEFTGSFLGSKNLEVVKAVNGRVAKTLLKNITPDLVVTDLMMDEMDGLTFIREMKSNKGLNHIPVIVLSAKSAGPTRVEVLNAGAQAFLSKPFLPEELFSVISNQLDLVSKIKSELKTKIETQKPDQTAEEKFNSTEPYTQKFFDLIFKNLDNSDLSVELLADLMATNRSHFQRKIKNLTGYSPSELIKLVRLEKSKEFLLAKKGNITEVAYMCGFSSQSYFTKCFTQHFGFSPTQLPNQ